MLARLNELEEQQKEEELRHGDASRKGSSKRR